MDLARQEYPSLLTSLEPDNAVDVLNSRVAVINKIHADIADWLTERRKIEEQYAASLRKLSRRPQQDNAATLGIFQMPWQRIVASIENLAQSHETLAAKIQTDVEAPLRQYHTTNREMQSMGNVAGNLSAIAKDLSSAQKKAHKLEAKGGNKAGGAQSNLDDAQAQWDSQAPFVFEQLQSLDEGRVNHLRDVLTQFQTHELDQVERVKASAESCINALLNVETADEIKTFAARTRNEAPTAPIRQDSITAPTRPSGSNVPPAPPPPRNPSTEQRNTSFSMAEPAKEKSKISGLKRFSTVIGRRKGAVPPPPPSASEKKKEKTRSFVPFRRQESSRSFQDLESAGADLSPSASRTSNRPELETPPATQESRISSTPPPALNGLPAIQQSPRSPRSPQSPQRDTSELLPQIRSLQEPLMPETIAQSPELQSSALSPQSRDARSDPFSTALDTPIVFGEEPSRNFEIKDQPIPEDESAAQLAMNSMANQLRMQAQSTVLNRQQSAARGRRDVRNTMFVPTPTTNELPSPTGTPSIGAPSTPASAVTAPTAFTSITTATPVGGSSSDIASPIKRSLGTGTIPEDHPVGSDTQSVHSSHSMALMPHHQEMHNPGLNASIVETVNTWFSETGVSRSFVVGEIALAYNNPSASATKASTHETVRLQNFHQLEKCAQNPTFVAASTLTEGQGAVPGTYTVALSSISRPIPTIAFKYQLHLPETSPNLSTYSPLLITQAWQVVEGQASVICFYSLNPAFAPIVNPGTSPTPPPAEIMLKNVTVTISLDTKPGTATSAGSFEGAPSTAAFARAVSAQMMPVQNAHFKKRAGSVVWRFPELTIKPTQEKLLVRFMVENSGLAKRGGVDVKFEIPNMLGSAVGVERLNTSESETGSKTNEAADPFADEDEAGARKSAEGIDRWEDVYSRKVFVAGKYTAS